MKLLNEFIAVFKVPQAAEPYAQMMVNEEEMHLLVCMKGRAMTAVEVANHIRMTKEETSSLLERGYSRGLLDKKVENKRVIYSPLDFYSFIPFYARFGNWDDIPKKARKLIHRWHYNEFITKRRVLLEQLMKGRPASELGSWTNHTIMLLSEAEQVIDAATDIALVPCDCRRLGQNCERPTETCIWMGENATKILDRGHGKRLSKEEAKEVIHMADKKGLIHTAQHDWQTRGKYSLCNCCACDCLLLTSAQEAGSKGFWPTIRYIASPDWKRCKLCGTCVERCHFNAFYHDGSRKKVKGKMKEVVKFDPEKCWGCGLCANTCPSQAIVMMNLKK